MIFGGEIQKKCVTDAVGDDFQVVFVTFFAQDVCIKLAGAMDGFTIFVKMVVVIFVDDIVGKCVVFESKVNGYGFGGTMECCCEGF